MAFDPCGTRTLDGEEIIKRLAKYLNIDPATLELLLIEQLEDRERRKTGGSK